MRLAALYGAPNHGAEWQRCYSALLACLEGRFGKGRVWQRNNAYYDKADVADDVLVAIIQGLRGGGKNYLARCVELGIPTLVVDLGWLRRTRGYWQVSYNGLNVAPPQAPSPDRFEQLQLKVFPPVKRNYNAVVVGQLPGDAQHDLRTERELLHWAEKASAEVHRLFPTKRLFWRPHPSFVRSLGKPTIMTMPTRQVQDFIKNEYIGGAVVYNSTLGLDLLRNGVHVIAQGPRTVYTDLVTSDIGKLENAHPGPEPVRALLERLAYGQYQLSELSVWRTLENLFELHGVTGDW